MPSKGDRLADQFRRLAAESLFRGGEVRADGITLEARLTKS